MQRSWLVGLLALVVLLGVGAVVVAVVMQGGKEGVAPTPDLARRPPGPPGASGPSGPAEGSQPRQRGEGIIRALQQSGATEEDTEKVSSFIQTRQQMLAELREALNELRTAAADENATDQQVSEALATFRQKKDEVSGKVEAERKSLTDALDLENRPRIAAALMAVGVLDNGLPFGGMGGGGRRGGAQRGAGGGERGAGGEGGLQPPRPGGPAPSQQGS